MKISTKGRYAIRLMIDLAQNGSGSPISLKEIAARQGISDKYSEQIISMLNKGGLVKSVRGAQGGYVLRSRPNECTVGMILLLTEGSLAPVSCLDDGSEECGRSEECVTVFLWKKINDAINDVVDHVTLQDILDWNNEKNGSYII